MKVKLFPKETCLAISKVIQPEEESELNLLYALPDWLFDGWYDVIEFHDNFVKMSCYYITPVSFISNIEP